MFSHVSVHPSIHPSVCPELVPAPARGSTPARSSGGVPHLEYPPSDLAGGTPVGRGYICWGAPHLRYPCWGYPTSGTPHQTWPGGVTLLGGTPLRETDGVLDMLQSVCLLRSTQDFLVLIVNIVPVYFK